MKPIILIKLGGSLITNKSKAFSERREIIADLVAQIKKAWDLNKYWLVVGHGGGSYPHVPAEKYKTIEGMIDSESVYGAAMVEDAAAQLNRIVVGEMLKQKVPAVSINPSSSMLLSGQTVKGFFLESMLAMLSRGVLPVVYGDVIFEENKGFTIWSTERILNFLASRFQETGMEVLKVIHCGETDGFLIDNKVVEEITYNNLELMKQNVHATAGFDVTGGMLHKVHEALSMAEAGVDSYIVGGNHGGNLYRTIIGKGFIGTRVTKL